MEEAARAGGTVAPATLARCYWEAGRLADAAVAYRAALRAAGDGPEQPYLTLCLQAVERNGSRRVPDQNP